MKTNFLQITLVVIMLFVVIQSSKAQSSVAGTYAVSKDDPSSIRLVIHSDQTFTYTDHSNSNKLIDVSGTYVRRGNTILLKSSSNTKFHHRWRIINGKIAKSRRGLCFYRICKLD